MSPVAKHRTFKCFGVNEDTKRNDKDLERRFYFGILNVNGIAEHLLLNPIEKCIFLI